jgi:hypothetical protein
MTTLEIRAPDVYRERETKQGDAYEGDNRRQLMTTNDN